MVSDNFTWIPFFEELLDVICKRYNPSSLYVEFKKLVPEDNYTDIDKIDPLTFIGCICAGNNVAIQRAKQVKENFNLKSPELLDIKGIPNFVHATYKFFHEIYDYNENERPEILNSVMQTLWDFANQINQNNINDDLFNKIVNFREVKVGKLSQIIYICKPKLYYSCDSTMLSYLYKNVDNNYNSFLSIQNYCKSLNINPCTLSVCAWDYSLIRSNFAKYLKKTNNKSYLNFIKNHIEKKKFDQTIFDLTNKKLFNIKTNSELDILLNTLSNNDNWITYNKNNGNGIPYAILNTHYRKFININQEKPKYWIFSAGENSYKWNEFYKDGIMALGWDYLGNLIQYNSQEDIANKITQHENRTEYPINDSKANWEFVKSMQIGDIVYVKKGLDNVLLGRGIVKSDYIYDENKQEYKSIRKVDWTHNGTYQVDFSKLEIKQWARKTLTDISEAKYGDFCLKIEEIFMKNNQKTDSKNIPLNQILYGPPGTGKTYNTVIKSMEIINKNCIEYDENGNVLNYEFVKNEFDKNKQNHQIEFLTFHQSYSYEEFVEGIKPNFEDKNLTYSKPDGIFKKICKNASKKLYQLADNHKSCEISFTDVLDRFKEKYPEGSDLGNLKNISYKKDELIYHFGKQEQNRKISLSKINELFINNKEYKTSIDFNKDYEGNIALKGYYHTFYKELMSVKNELEDENQILIENDQKYVINENAPKYVLIIDEINRGNISKIFGELITLIEPDKRKGAEHELKVSLPYSPTEEPFGVPKNLYIIGTMNTSDRSIASIDIALRRRFKFVEIMPKPELVADFGCKFNVIFEKLNKQISVLLDRDHQIGHSYFINTKYNDENGNNNIDTLKEIWFSEILPLLNEYFYGDWEKLCAILGTPKANNKSFIKKIEDVQFANNYCCDEDDRYDFVPKDDINFEEALRNAFGNMVENNN